MLNGGKIWWFIKIVGVIKNIVVWDNKNKFRGKIIYGVNRLKYDYNLRKVKNLFFFMVVINIYFILMCIW